MDGCFRHTSFSISQEREEKVWHEEFSDTKDPFQGTTGDEYRRAQSQHEVIAPGVAQLFSPDPGALVGIEGAHVHGIDHILSRDRGLTSVIKPTQFIQPI
jgi:hypothetical protein